MVSATALLEHIKAPWSAIRFTSYLGSGQQCCHGWEGNHNGSGVVQRQAAKAEQLLSKHFLRGQGLEARRFVTRGGGVARRGWQPGGQPTFVLTVTSLYS